MKIISTNIGRIREVDRNGRKIVKQFLEAPYPGVYLRILKEGHAKVGDVMTLSKYNPNGMTVREIYSLFSGNKKNKDLKALACEQEFLADSIKKSLV